MPEAATTTASPASGTTATTDVTATTQAATNGAATADIGWRSSLPDDIRADATLAKYTDVTALSKAHIDLQKKMGIPSIPKPQANWTAQDYEKHYTELGRPEKPDGYGFKPLEKVPEGMTYSPEQDKWFMETAHKAGLTTAQATMLRESFVQMQVQQNEGLAKKTADYKAMLADGDRKIRMEFGPKYDAMMDGAQRVVAQFGSPELKTLLEQTGLHEHPAIVRFVANVGSVLNDHSVITGIPRLSGNFQGGPAAAQAELTKMETDPNTAKILADAHHPQHDNLVKRRAELHRAMVPVQS
jgi:hypothetical protein